MKEDRITLIPMEEPERTRLLQDVLRGWKESNTFSVLSKWRNELYPVYSRGDDGKVILIAKIERCAVGLFGFRAYGCHLTGYVRPANGKVAIWVGKRSKTKQNFPSMLDNIVSMLWFTRVLQVIETVVYRTRLEEGFRGM
jgi:hypothetical protein